MGFQRTRLKGPMVTAVYAGSFDPPTIGHLNIVERASTIFDSLIIAIGVNSAKKPLFDMSERTTMFAEAIRQRPAMHGRKISIRTFDGLLINFCKQQGATVLVRGLRAAMDFEYELGIAQANATQAHDVQTVFLATEPQYSFVASSVVKEIAKYGGSVSDFVDRAVEIRLYDKFGRDAKGQLKI
jgi:pantetheine-phosphate adenylyltransferase